MTDEEGGGDRKDVTQLRPLLDDIPPVRGPDLSGYDHDIYRHQVRTRGIFPAIARCSTPHGSGLGAYRCCQREA